MDLQNIINLSTLVILSVLLLVLLRFVLKSKKKNQLHKVFVAIFVLMLIWLVSLIAQLLLIDTFNYNIDMKYFFDIYYISLCFLPVAFLFMSLIFSKDKISFNIKHILLLIIPTISVLLVWTNDYHHLFYKQFSDAITTEYGWYFYYVHTIYTYALYIVSLFILQKYSIRNSGFFSKQAILVLAGTLVPLVVNLLGVLQIIEISIYTTPITFAITIVFLTFAIFKFDLLKITPIALQKIVDRISDSYVIINDDYNISDFNKTFADTFEIDSNKIRGKNFLELLKKFDNSDNNIIEIFKEKIDSIEKNLNTISFELEVTSIQKTFTVEINYIFAGNSYIGILVLFKDITQHKKDMEIIRNNQNMLIERERLASLGQMVGGIAHSLKTPIFSVSGGIEGLMDLIREFDLSIDNPSVNSQDMHDIASDMNDWIVKIKTQVSYMSEIITTVKGQAVTLSGDDKVTFNISELFNHTYILMKHEIQNALLTLNINNNVDDSIILNGNINSLVQVLNNLISNAIQAYNHEPNKKIDMSARIEDETILISIKDYGPGIPEKIRDKLFKEMITTKGKEGTGLGLFMSHSMIKAKFNGDIKFITSSKGTEFTIYIPMK